VGKILRALLLFGLAVGTAKEQPLPTLLKHAQYVPTILKMAKVQFIIISKKQGIVITGPMHENFFLL